MEKSLSGVGVTLIHMNFVMSRVNTELKVSGIRLIGLKILSHLGGKSRDLLE
jgi:hypothetical protein|tara:strand:- start:242 stop:397 length:156 start_codon:yes stop_codon:yes gene_type:complete